MIKYFLQKWKDVMRIGRQENLHYLERQRIVMLNAISLVAIIGSVLITIAYYLLDFSNKNIGLIVLPTCFLVFWFNHKKNYRLARNIIFFGMLITITFWSFYTRRTGGQYLYIALASGSVSIFRQRIFAFVSMIICSVLYFAYIYFDNTTPFVGDKNIDYMLINSILTYTSAGIVFFQAMMSSDISNKISKKLDKKFDELNLAIENQKITEEKLKSSNSQLSDFNKKLDFLVKKSSEELYSYQAAIDDNLNSVVTDVNGVILKINNIYLEKTGYIREELLGKNISILKSNFHDEIFYENINKIISSGRVWRGESKIKTKDNTTFWIFSSILPVKDTNGNITKFLTISSNITKQKIAQENEKLATFNLAKSENRLSLFLDNQTDLVTITDKAGNRKYANKAFCEFFGKTKDELIGTNYKSDDPDDIDESYIELFNSISSENPKIATLIIKTNASGEKRWIQWNEIAFFDENNVLEILCIGHDITEIKESEFQKANYITQFEELAFKNSHHFRRPLSNIMGVIALIDEESTKSEINELVGIIKNEINELDNASHELSDFISSNSKKSIE